VARCRSVPSRMEMEREHRHEIDRGLKCVRHAALAWRLDRTDKDNLEQNYIGRLSGDFLPTLRRRYMSQQNSVAPNVVHALSGLGVKLAMAGLVLAVVCAAAAIFSGLGYRLGLWHFRTGFAILQGAFWIALAAALISLAGLILGRNAGPGVLYMGLLGVLIAGVTAYIPWSYKHTVSSVPFIHDITTDVSNPPVFVTAATLRKEGDNPVAYDGPEVGAQQKEAYPDLAPLIVKAPKDQVFDVAKSTLTSMGLEITGASPADGRVEAVATTLLFGFKDDVVVRIEESPQGTRVDVRSKSRLGRSDLGVNANRIRTFLGKLRSALPAA